MTPSQTDPEGGFSSECQIPDFDSLPDRYGWPRDNGKGYRIKEQLFGTGRPMRVIHVGAGTSGICIAKMLPQTLKNVSLTCYDKNSDIGGTWLENRYPGCACDIPSVNYQFTWDRKPDWSHFYSYSEEIWQYFKDIVDRFGLMKYIKLNHEIMGANWDDEAGQWNIKIKNLNSGIVFSDQVDVFINGGGILNNWKWLDTLGLHDFKGSGLLSLGLEAVEYKLQRILLLRSTNYTPGVRSPAWITAGFAQGHAGPDGANFEYSPEQKKRLAESPAEYIRYCKEIEDELNQRFKFILNGTPEAAEAKEFSTNQMKQKLSGREDLMLKIIPTNFGVGCRRPTPGNGFLEALTRSNVKTFTQGMQRITPKGFIDNEGIEHEVDVIICATGFNTSWVPRFPINALGRNVQDLFADKPVSYLSIGAPEIPNYWTVTGAYGPVGHGSLLQIIELLVKHFLACIKKTQVENIKSLAQRREICEAFVEHADLFLKRTAWASGCSSWFKRGTVAGPLTIWPGSRLVYFGLLKEPRFKDYRIIYRSSNPFEFLGNGFSTREYDGSVLSYYLNTK